MIYFNEFVRLNGLPKIIISDSDVKLTSYFWKILWHKMKTKIQFSSAFHPQTDGQTELVNMSLGNLLRCLIGESLRTWDLVLHAAEFAYNTSVNRTKRMSSFEVVHGYQPRQPIDLILMAPHHTRMSESAASFASHSLTCIRRSVIKSKKVIQTIKPMQIWKKAQEFNVRDYVMVQIHSVWYPPSILKIMMHAVHDLSKFWKKIILMHI